MRRIFLSVCLALRHHHLARGETALWWRVIGAHVEASSRDVSGLPVKPCKEIKTFEPHLNALCVCSLDLWPATLGLLYTLYWLFIPKLASSNLLSTRQSSGSPGKFPTTSQSVLPSSMPAKHAGMPSCIMAQRLSGCAEHDDILRWCQNEVPRKFCGQNLN
jgi:hypothetical protein